ncbi:hypothetical protein AX15_006143 [Amanita polypyramis BW_CC]|nr:hypothetical protein AX15_006143 [Amanita polypyramis BW_CC]
MSPESEDINMVIVNPAPIRHRDDMIIEENTKPSIYKGKFKEAMNMDTSDDFSQNDLKTELVAETKVLKEKLPTNMDMTEDFPNKESSEVSYYTALSTLSAEIRKYAKDITPLTKKEDKFRRSHMPLQTLSYELYGDLLVQWLVTRKYIKQAINIPSDGSMEKITWSYLNALFDHRFNDTLSEKDFLHCIKGLHGILEKDVQKKYDIANFGKEGISVSVHAPAKERIVEKIVEKIVYVEKESKQANSSTPTPSLLQQRKMKNKATSKSSSYEKDEVKNILTMASQLSDKLDIPITDAFNKAEEILSITQTSGRSSSRSRSRSRNRQTTTDVKQQPWYTSDPQKVMELTNTIKALLDAKPKVTKKRVPKHPMPKSDNLSPVSLGPPIDDYNEMMAKQNNVSNSSSQQDRPGELQYPPASLESQIAREQVKNKNRSRPPPPGDSLAPYEEVVSAESWQKRSVPSTQTSPPTAELSSYAAAAKRFYEKLPTPEWVEVRKKKAQAAIRPATKPNQFFVRPQVQSLLNHFKPGLRSTGRKLLIELQDAIKHQENWDIIMDKTKLIYAEWTSSNALLLTTDIPLSQDQQGLYRMAVAHYLEQEVSEMRILNRPTTSSLRFCRVPTRNTWDGKVFTEDDLLRMIQADKLWKNAEIFGKPRFIKPKHVDSLPPVATVLIDIKDTKKGEDAKALIGSTVVFNGQHCRCLPWVNNDVIPQCQSCYRWGHTKFVCRMTFVTCARCGDNHPTDSHVLYCGDCLNGGNCERITCVNCQGNGKDNHSALDTNCPFRRAQNNRETMRVLMEDYRARKAQRIEENAHAREQQRKEAEKTAKKKGLTVRDLRAMLDNVEVVKGREPTKTKTGPLGKTTARKSVAQPPAARLIIKPGEPSRVEGVTIKKPKFGKPRTPSPKGMDVDNPIQINSSPLEGSSASKNLDPHV